MPASDVLMLNGIKDATVSELDCTARGADACIEINTLEGELKSLQYALRPLDIGIPLSINEEGIYFDR